MLEKNLMTLSQSLEDIVTGGQDLLGLEIGNLKSKHAVDEPHKLQAVVQELKQENRLMSIGIVGRVKAGKSALLNALFFDGESVLPSAATPMTAALTTLTYGERCSVDVDFYSAEDRKNIQAKADEYRKKLDEEIKTLRENRRSSNNENPSELNAKLKRMAEKALKQQYEVLAAAFDQYSRMQDSGLLHQSLEKYQKIDSSNLQELAKALLQYVGADGKFMPFTKSVNICLPIEQLRDIRVIDTPGFNDPVQSREARTMELLKSCDVIFIVSPAGQFLNDQDQEMMGRITQKEGIREIFVVASQVDTQLFGSEKRNSVQETIANITRSLSKHMVATLNQFKKKYPEIGTTFDQIIEQETILFSSGICHALAKKEVKADLLNSNETHVWNNLTQTFPDYFTNADIKSSIESLNLLSNIEVLKGKIENVRLQKDQIMQQHLEKLLKDKEIALKEYIKGLKYAADEKVKILDSTDIDTIHKKIRENKNSKAKVEREINDAYDSLHSDIKGQTLNELSAALDNAFRIMSRDVDNQQKVEIERYTVEKTGMGNWVARKLWGGGSETRTREVVQVFAHHIVQDVDVFLDKVRNSLIEMAERNNKSVKEGLNQKLLGVYRGVANDEDIDEDLVYNVFKSIVNGMKDLKPNIDVKLPDKFVGRNILKGQEAEDYMEDIQKYLRKFKDNLRKEITDYSERVSKVFDQDIGKKFTKVYEEQLESLENQVSHKKMTIDRIQMFKAKLGKVAI